MHATKPATRPAPKKKPAPRWLRKPKASSSDDGSVVSRSSKENIDQKLSSEERLDVLEQRLDELKSVPEKLEEALALFRGSSPAHPPVNGKVPKVTRRPSKQHTEEEVEAIIRARPDTAGKPNGAGLDRFFRLATRKTVQQELNLCQTTAIGLALTSMGFPTTVDDLLMLVEVPVESAVGDGMTLSESFDLTTRYIQRARLPVTVHVHHFDAFSGLTVEHLMKAVVDKDSHLLDGALAFNFHSGIAHGWETGGGGHFAICLGNLDGGDILMHDVHAIKYGAYWSTPAVNLFEAMADKDSCGRARGILQFGLTKTNSSPMPSLAQAPFLVNWSQPPGAHDKFLLKRFVPHEWDTLLGATNLSGINAIVLALHAFRAVDSASGFSERHLMKALRLSYLTQLHKFQSAESIATIAENFFQTKAAAKASLEHSYAVTLLGLGRSSHTCTEALVSAEVNDAATVVLLPIDLNMVKGGTYIAQSNSEAAALAHDPCTWVAIASIDPSADSDDPTGVVLCATTNVIRDGRLFTCSMNNLVKATYHGAVRDGQCVVMKRSMRKASNAGKLDELFRLLDKDGDGEVTVEELHEGVNQMGIALSMDEAEKLVKQFNRDDLERSLNRNELFEMLNTVAGMRPGHDPASHRFKMLKSFMEENGCIKNELGFATCHMALATANIPNNVAFYNQTLGWPLFKTVDRAHAGAGEESYGSSWASYGAFASFIVFHLEDVPIGSTAHGPWVGPAAPAAFRDSQGGGGGRAGSIAFDDLPLPFLGVVLEPDFFEKQMARIRKINRDVKWVGVEGAEGHFGGDLVASAIAFNDPDGYPLVFFVAKLDGAAYEERFPAVPFVYATPFRVSPNLDDDLKGIFRPLTEAMKALLGKDTLSQVDKNKHFFSEVCGAHLLREETLPGGVECLEFSWEGHLLYMKSEPDYCPPSLRNNKSDGAEHNMGGNKGVVPLPHFGPNTDYTNFDLIRKKVEAAEASNNVPHDDNWCLARIGHAYPMNCLDSHNMLFPTDVDSCLSMFLVDPSGNAYECKWYLDFGEMFHHSGEVGVAGLHIDNSMVPDHFPPSVMKLMEERALKGDKVAKDTVILSS